MPRVLGIGDNTVDIYVDQNIQFPGGNAVNVAVFCQRLGADASYLGCIGNDLFGDLIQIALKKEQIDLEHVRFMHEPNPWSRIRHVEGDRVFDGSLSTKADHYKLNSSDFEYIADFDLIHSSIYSKLEGEIANIASVSKITSFDFSDEFDRFYLKAVAPSVDIAILSDPEGSQGSIKTLCKEVASLGPSTVIVTQGAKGATCYNAGNFYAQAIIETEIVDTLGAGDGFIAGFLMSRLNNDSIPDAMKKAAQYAGTVCGFKGAFGHGIVLKSGQPGLIEI